MIYNQKEIFRPIKTWAEDDRPREKFLQRGPKSLSDSELLAIIISTGSGTETALDLARNVLQNASNNFSKLSKSTVHDLKQLKGIGEVKAITILAALELGLRRFEAEPEKRKKITTSQEAYLVLCPFLMDLPHEEFYTIYLNRANQVMQVTQISRGGIHATSVDQRLIFQNAIKIGACGLILAHNHPSGGTTPSDHDLSLTRQIVQAGKLMQINVLDHIIIGDNAFLSFSDTGLI
jgi:DNA repair protein RadC